MSHRFQPLNEREAEIHRRNMRRNDILLAIIAIALAAVSFVSVCSSAAYAGTGDQCEQAMFPTPAERGADTLGMCDTRLGAGLGLCPEQAVDDEPTELERRIIDRAVTCANARWRPVDPWRLWRLLEHEERAGVPRVARGIVLAAACQESGYVEDGRRGDAGRARGVLQLWPWYRDRYGVDRGDDDHSAEVWLYHLVRQLPGTERACRGVRKRWRETASQALWRRASARAVRSHRYSRCNESTGHWRKLLRWQRKWGR